MSTTYRNTVRNHIRSAMHMIQYMVSITVLLLAFMYFGNVEANVTFVILMVCAALTLTICIPAIVLHFTYFMENRNTVLTIDHSLGVMEIKKGNHIFKYSIRDVDAANWKTGFDDTATAKVRRSRTTPWSGYYYLKLKFKDNRSFIFTSLMLNKHVMSTLRLES